MRPQVWISLALAALTLAVFVQVRHHEFVDYDDPRAVSDNPHLRDGLTGTAVWQAFSEHYFGNWIPLTSLSLLINAELSGREPAGFLLTNVGLHALASLVLFLALLRMTGALWRSAFVAAVFAIHPLHVESVVWASERKDVLSGLFWMLTLYAYAAYAERPSPGRYLLVALALALGLLSKPMLVTLPFALLLLDYWPLGRLRRDDHRGLPDPGRLGQLALEKLPLLLMVALVSVVTFAVQDADGAMFTLEQLSLPARLNNALESYVVYVAQSVWPSGLAAFYPHGLEEFSAWRGAAAGLTLALVTAAAIRFAPRRPYLPVGWFWYLGTLVPVIGIVQVGMQAHADRYMYIPLIGLALIAAWGVHDLLARGRTARVLGACAGSAAVALLAAAAWVQVGTWRDTIVLHSRVVAIHPDSFRSHNHLATALLRRGEVEAAERHYARAVELEPDWGLPRLGLADVAMARGELDAAIAGYRRALVLDPTHSNGTASLGRALLRSGRPAEARAAFERALALQDDADRVLPRGAPPHFGLADVALTEGDFAAAVAHLERGLALAPDDAAARAKLGLALRETGRADEARRQLERALALGAEDAAARAALADLYNREGRFDAAARLYRDALRLDPAHLQAANNLAWLLATTPDPRLRSPDEAIRWAEGAAGGGGPEQAALLDTLAASYAAAGRFEDATRTAERALALARAKGEAEVAREIRAHLALYRSGRPVVESADAAP